MAEKEQRKNNMRMEQEYKIAEENRRKAENSKRRWRRYTINTFAKIILYCVIVCACFTTWFYGLVAPIIAIPVASVSIAVGSMKFGVWFSRANNRYRKK